MTIVCRGRDDWFVASNLKRCPAAKYGISAHPGASCSDRPGRARSPPWFERATPTVEGRVDRSRDLILSCDSSDLIEVRLDEIEAPLLQANQDKERLADALTQLDPDRVAAEL